MAWSALVSSPQRFVANEKLGFVVAFPIIFSGPGIVASILGICFTGELKGVANMLVAALVAVLVSSGAVLISLSRLCHQCPPAPLGRRR